MGRGKGQTSWEEQTELLKYLIYIFNSIFFCAGALVFAVGLWIRFDKNLNDYVDALNMYHYYTGPTIVMVAASLVMLNSFLACCGVYISSRRVLILYMVMTVLTFILLLAGAAYTLENGLEQSKIYPWIQENMRLLIHRYQWEVTARRSIDIVQEHVGCCGGYSYRDFTDIHLPVPNTCRDQVTGNQHLDSCAEILSQYLEVRTGWLAGLSLSLCFFQCFAVMISVCMYLAMKERDYDKRRGL